MITQNYGALRVVRVRSARPPDGSINHAVKYPTGWLPEEGLVHVLTQRETSIGRALNNDVVLMDPTVSREHARLVLDRDGWHIINLTARNIHSHLLSHRGQVLMVRMREELPPFKAASHNHQCNSLFLCNLTPNTKRNSGEMTKTCSERV